MPRQLDCIADTSAVIGLLRRDEAVETTIRNQRFAITFVTLAELSLGVLKAARPEAAWARILDVIGNREMFHVSTMTPAIYARIYFDLEQCGVMIPINDIWIAALAIEARLPIVARDEHFSRVTRSSGYRLLRATETPMAQLCKPIGHKSRPNSRTTFPNKKAASIVWDTIKFHGAKLTVDVHNMYRSRLLRELKMDVAAERSVTLEEDGLECSLDSHFASITLRKHKRGEEPPYGAFIWELPRRALKKFPLLIKYTKDGELAEVSVLR